MEEKWVQNYEFINDYVVPRSTKRFKLAGNKDHENNIGLWRVVVFRDVEKDF